MSLVQIFPDLETVLALEPEELGGAILEILNGTAESFTQTTITGGFDQPFMLPLEWRHADFAQIRFAVAEAFAWLERSGLIMSDFKQPAAGGWFLVLTKRGRELRDREQVKLFRGAALLPVGLVHPEILPKVHPPFLRGDYEVAVFAAFRGIEVAVRKAAGYPDNALGVPMMRDAFKPNQGPLADKASVFSEQEAIAHLFAGAIGAAKNPASHRDVEMDRTEAVRLILFASYLLSIVDTRFQSSSPAVSA